MIRERSKGATKDDVARVLQAFSRAVETRKLHPGNGAVLTRALGDLQHAMEGILTAVPELLLLVEPEALLFSGSPVLEGPSPSGSIPLVLFRDGIRKLFFKRGVTRTEMEVLVSATARGLSFGGIGDDVVSSLWQHNLTHLRYELADTTVDSRGDNAKDVAEELNAVVASMAGDQEGQKSEGIVAAIVEGSDSDAFQPLERFVDAPAYREELLRELSEENEATVAARAQAVLLRVWREAKAAEDGAAARRALLKMFDTALVEDDVGRAAAIAASVRDLPDETAGKDAWLEEASTEPRLRRMVGTLSDQPARLEEVLSLVDAFGRPAVPAMLAILPALGEAAHRRALSERIVQYGVDDLEAIKNLINREPSYLAAEAIFILGRTATPEAQAAIRDARVHPRLYVRLALVEMLRQVPAELALQIALDLLARETDPKVLAATARALPRYKTKETVEALENAAVKLAERPLPFDTKLAILAGYAAVSQGRAVPLLVRYVKRGEGLLARKDAEELAAAALRALGVVRGHKTSDLLAKASESRSKLVKETAIELIEQQKEQR